MPWGIRSGGRVFEHARGQDQWAYLQANPRQEHQFSSAMACIEHLGAGALTLAQLGLAALHQP